MIAAAGDIAPPTGPGGSTATASIVTGLNPSMVAPLGDTQYYKSTLAEFTTSYDKSWGRFNGIARPVTGNHEYQTPGAQGYKDYFHRSGGAFAYTLGTWRLYALNSNCEQTGVSCSYQISWLKADIDAHPTACILAYWHHPLYTTGLAKYRTATTPDEPVGPFWTALYSRRADVILNGHFHAYEEWMKQDPRARRDANGIKQFTVGMGGYGEMPFDGVKSPNVGPRYNDEDGVLSLTLHSDSYTYSYITAPSGVRYTKTATCNVAGPIQTVR